jgi:shikimate kinase
LPNYPNYPELGSGVAKYRRKAALLNGLSFMSKDDRRAYAAAITKAIRSKQRQELQRVLPSHNVICASGTSYTTGKEIDKAIKQQQRASLLAYPSKVRKERTDQEWLEMYQEAMAEKRNRETKRRPSCEQYQLKSINSTNSISRRRNGQETGTDNLDATTSPIS